MEPVYTVLSIGAVFLEAITFDQIQRANKSEKNKESSNKISFRSGLKIQRRRITLIKLKENPFFLSDEQIEYVNKTLNSMSPEEKLGQLFCLISYSDNEEELEKVLSIKPGGLMCRPMSMEDTVRTVKKLQGSTDIPMLIAANLEKGGNGICEEGTFLGTQMEVAATGELRMAKKLGTVCGREGSVVGCNWSFSPIIDIDYNYRNPITNLRTFGSDPERVKNMGVEYVRAVQKHGVAASIKHFPGDGMDERDQHLVTSINSMTCDEWDKTYGEAYKACIEEGTMTAMIGHIMHPAYSKKLDPSLKDEDILPASLSKEIVTGLLREKLGFNGLIVTDATTMAGMTIPMTRSKAVPMSIAIGCDMFLFARNLDEDYAYMKRGIETGIITQERLNDAVTRILALKAALKLPEKHKDGSIIPRIEEARKIVGCKEHKGWAKECADKAITLVKEEKGVLPINPDKYKKVLFYDIESTQGFAYSVRVGATEKFKNMLADEGFRVDQFNSEKAMEGIVKPYSDIEDNYDLIIYMANLGTKSNQTIVRIEWALPMGANVPIYMSTVPTIFISIENPYHLVDVPRIRTFINTYASTDTALEALMDKLMGRSEFKGKSPVDAFCGRWDTRLS